MKIFICLALLAAATASPLRQRRGIIHQEAEGKSGGESLGASGFHHEIEHEHAKSHQSVKLEHFHPVPVYVKKEHAHLLKHPVEKGKSEHTVKLLHPKTEQNHGYGLVLEEHRSDLESGHGYGGGIGGGEHGFSEHSDDISQIEHIPEHHGLSELSQGGHGEGAEHGFGGGEHGFSGGEQGYGGGEHGFSGGEHGFSGGDHGFSGGDHGFGGGEQYASYETKGIDESQQGHYQYQPIDLSHLGGHEAAGGKEY